MTTFAVSEIFKGNIQFDFICEDTDYTYCLHVSFKFNGFRLGSFLESTLGLKDILRGIHNTFEMNHNNIKITF